MPKSTESLNRSLFDLLRTKGYNPTMMDTSGKEIPVPEEADVFQFDFVKDGTQYGKVTISIDGLQKLTVYFNDDVANSDKGNDDTSTGTDWYTLLKQLKKFATHRQLSFELKNSSHLKHDMAKREYMSNKEKIREGYYPMGKKASYSDAIPSIKIVIEHSRQLEEGEARFRSINRIFLENQSGERYLLDTKKPGVARVYARHIAEGGKVNDQRWDHIGSLVEEYSKMSGFVRATKNGQFNESAQQLVNEGVQHYQTLRETLSRMTGHRGYNSYFESWSPSLMEDEADTSNINELFVQETLDPRIESVMPILSKLHKKVSEMKEVNDLSDWADSLLEGDGEELKEFAPIVAAVGGALARGAAVNAVTDAFSDDDEIDEGFGDHGLSQDTLDLIDEYIAKVDPTQDRDEMIQDILDGTIHMSELEYALQDEMDEGLGDVAKKVGGAIKSAGKKALDVIAPGDDELISQLRKSAGINTPHNKPSMARSEVEKRVDEEDMAEGSVDQLPTKDADYSKYDTDHLKMMLRPGMLHRNEARFKALIRKELQKREQQSQQGVEEGYTVTRGIDKERYQERPGLEGPFSTKSGKVVYYDKVEGKYYDPDTDMYIEYDEWQSMNEQSVSEGKDKLTPQQKAHEYNLDAAQREIDRREAEGEDMTGAKIDKKTYKIIKPKQDVAEDLAAIKKLAGRSSPTENFINTDAQAVVTEEEDRPYVCVHAKKGKCEVKASSSYQAAQKAATKWGLKNTSGIDAHLADVKKDPASLEEGQDDLAAMLRIINR